MSYTDVIKRIGLLLLVAAWVLSASTAYAGPDKDKDKSPRKQRTEAASKNGSTLAECTVGTASADLNVNNVNARLFNTGSLFYSHTGSNLYEVPNGSGLSPIFAHGLWIGGTAGGELRMSAATYAQFGEEFEFFPGPLDASGNPPSDCNQYDRIFSVTKADINAYNTDGTATQDMLDWPWQLGAPVKDGDGNPNNYNLAGGDRPDIIGDQTAWWIMNDAAGQHLTTLTNPIGLEAQVMAFAFKSADALNNTTFYKYKIRYQPKTNVPLENTWIGLFSDPDLGDPNDDFVGSDTTLGLGYIYNGDPFDGTSTGYGDKPPAAGYDFFQGPLVNNDGLDNDFDGTTDEPDERLKMTRFIYYNNDNTAINGNPSGAQDFYNYLQGLWRDNSKVTCGGDGTGGTETCDFMFTGDPPNYWSEDNADGRGAKNTPSDRRFLMSTGPFTMQPGDEQEIVFGIVWSQTADRVGSIKQLKADDIQAQGAFDFNFQVPPPPDAPALSATEMDGEIVLTWDNPASSNNYLNLYDVASPYLVDQNASDTTYTFEGYKIYQYASLETAPEDGTLIATMDVNNGITTIVDNKIDPFTGAPIRSVVAQGSDSGIQNFLAINQDVINDRALRNFSEYVFGIQAYAYNPFSDPQIRQSPVVRVRVVPQGVEARNGGTKLNAERGGDFTGELTAGIGEGAITAVVADPTQVTGDAYDVKFYGLTDDEGNHVMTYDLVNKTKGTVLVSGEQYFAKTGQALPQGNDLFVKDGLSFSISGPEPTITSFQVVSNGAGPLNPPEIGAFAFNSNGFPFLTLPDGTETDRPSEAQQVADGEWGIQQGTDPTATSFDDFLFYVTRDGVRWATTIPNDFEIRFTERGGKGLIPADYTGADQHYLVDIPFELWNVGTSDGPEDDVRYFPYIWDLDFEDPAGGKKFSLLTQPGVDATQGEGAVPADHALSGGANDPYTDLFYWVIPEDQSPGEAGYNALVSLIESDIANYSFLQGAAGRAFERMVLVNWNGGDVTTGEYNQIMVEPGTTFRIVTSKPIAEGDVYTVNTSGFGKTTNDKETATAALEKIAVVPNPYRGASAFDVSPFQDEARITNLPVGSRVRVFTLSGTLIYEDTQRSADGFYRWDLTTNDGLPLASGMYLIHVDVPDVGERVLKFGVIKKRVQVDVF